MDALEVKTQISSDLSNVLGAIDLDAVDDDEFCDKAIELMIIKASQFYKIRYGTNSFEQYFLNHRTDDNYYQLRYPYRYLLRDDLFDLKYFTFDCNGNPFYIRFEGMHGKWEFISDNKLYRNNICYNFYMMYQSTESEFSIKRKLRERPHLFYFVKYSKIAPYDVTNGFENISLYTVSKCVSTELSILKETLRKYGKEVASAFSYPIDIRFGFNVDKYNALHSSDIRVGELQVYKTSKFKGTSVLWQFKLTNCTDLIYRYNMDTFREYIKRALCHIRAGNIAHNGGIITVRFRFKYQCLANDLKPDEHVFLPYKGIWLLVTYNTVRPGSDSVVMAQSTDYNAIVDNVRPEIFKLYSVSENGGSTYSDGGEHSEEQYLCLDEFQIEVITSTSIKYGANQIITGTSAKHNEIKLELQDQTTNKSSKKTLVKSISWGKVWNKVTSKNACFIQCLLMKLEDIFPINGGIIKIKVRGVEQLFYKSSYKSYLDLWKKIDCSIGRDTNSTNCITPFDDDYIDRVSEMFNFCITIYDINQKVIKTFLPTTTIDKLNILAYADTDESNYHFMYIESMTLIPEKTIDYYKETDLIVYINMKTVNYLGGVYPYMLEYYIKPEDVQEEGDVNAILIKNDCELLSYQVLDDFFKAINDYIGKKVNKSMTYSSTFIDFCSANNLKYDTDLDAIVSHYIIANQTDATFMTGSWKQKFQNVYKSQKFIEIWEQYKVNNPLNRYNVKLITYNGSIIDFNILFKACQKLDIEITVPPPISDKIIFFKFNLNTPYYTQISVDCWDINNFFRTEFDVILDKIINVKYDIEEEIRLKKEVQLNFDNNNNIATIYSDETRCFNNTISSIISEIPKYLEKIKSALEENISRISHLSPISSIKKNIIDVFKEREKTVLDFATISQMSYALYLKSNTIYKVRAVNGRRRSHRYNGKIATHKILSKLKTFTPERGEENESINFAIKQSAVGPRVCVEPGKYIFAIFIGLEVDYNSLYPGVMLFYKYPIGTPVLCYDISTASTIFSTYDTGFFYCEYTNVVCDNNLYFYLPYPTDTCKIWKVADKPDWKTCVRSGFLTKIEIQDLLARDPTSVKLTKAPDNLPVAIYWDNKSGRSTYLDDWVSFLAETTISNKIINTIEDYVLAYSEFANTPFNYDDDSYEIKMFNPSVVAEKFTPGLHILEYCFYTNEKINLSTTNTMVAAIEIKRQFNLFKLVDLLILQSDSIFTTYFKKLLHIKNTSKNSSIVAFVKSLLNNLSGKFSSSAFNTSTIIVENSNDLYQLYEHKIMSQNYKILMQYLYNTSIDIDFKVDINKLIKEEKRELAIIQVQDKFSKNRLFFNPMFEKPVKELVAEICTLFNSIIDNKEVSSFSTYEDQNFYYISTPAWQYFIKTLYDATDKENSKQFYLNIVWIWKYPKGLFINFQEYLNTYMHVDFMTFAKNNMNDNMYSKILNLIVPQLNTCEIQHLFVEYEQYLHSESNKIYFVYENIEKRSKFPVQIGNYIFANSRSCMWNNLISKVKILVTDTDSGFISAEDLPKLKDFHIPPECTDIPTSQIERSIENKCGVLVCKNVFDTLYVICNKVYLALYKGECDEKKGKGKFRIAGVHHDSLCVSNTILNRVIEIQGASEIIAHCDKEEITNFHEMTPTEKDKLFKRIPKYIDLKHNALSTIFNCKSENYDVFKFSDNLIKAYEILLVDSLHFSEEGYIASRRKDVFNYIHLFKEIGAKN